jgi:magnesium-transporting ATPase (P-type)
MMLFISNWLYIPLALLAMLDLCTFSKTTMLYNNMAFILPLPLLLGFCRSSSKNTSTTPVINILAPRHQLIMWVHNFIFTIAFICCFEIYWTSKEY